MTRAPEPVRGARALRAIPRAALALGLALHLVPTAAPSAPAETPSRAPSETVAAATPDLASARADLERGLALFGSKKGAKRLAPAEAAFTSVIDRLAPSTDALDPEGRLIFARALDHRAQTNLLRGKTKAGEDDFTRLVSFDPAYAPDARTTPRKTLDRFRRIRAARVAFVTLQIDPSDAEITWNGRALGPIATTPTELPVLAGPYTMRLARTCYEDKEATGDIGVGERRTLGLALDPFARIVRFETSAAGYDIDIDGTLAGTTRADEPSRDEASPEGGPAEPARGALELPCLTAGEHVYTVRRECYAEVEGTLTVEIDLLDKTPLVVPVPAPNKRETRLSVASDTPGAVLYLDGEAAGPLPVRDRLVCAPRMTMEARVGERVVWSETRDLEDGPLDLTARRRPTLGLAIDESLAGEGAPLAAALRRRAGELASFNVVDVAPGSGKGMGGAPPADARGDRAKHADGRTPPVDLRLEARRVDGGAGGEIEMRLVPVAMPGLAWTRTCPDDGVGESPCYEETFAAIDAPWPAAAGATGEESAAGATRIEPPGTLGIPLPRAIAAMGLDASVLPSGRERNASLMALASALIGAGAYREALDQALEGPQWADGAGGAASRGTAAFLAGICHQALGEDDAARAAFRRAASDASATLWTDDGLPVAPLARIALAAPAAKSR